MKKSILILGAAVLTLVSCKKDYSCKCTDTDTYMGVTDIDVYQYNIKDATKKQAQTACSEATVTYTGTSGDTYSTKCELSK